MQSEAPEKWPQSALKLRSFLKFVLPSRLSHSGGEVTGDFIVNGRDASPWGKFFLNSCLPRHKHSIIDWMHFNAGGQIYTLILLTGSTDLSKINVHLIWPFQLWITLHLYCKLYLSHMQWSVCILMTELPGDAHLRFSPFKPIYSGVGLWPRLHSAQAILCCFS